MEITLLLHGEDDRSFFSLAIDVPALPRIGESVQIPITNDDTADSVGAWRVSDVYWKSTPTASGRASLRPIVCLAPENISEEAGVESANETFAKILGKADPNG